ncbi:MAG: DUF2069 domain-containing protein [Kangiellaceae bacterium]|jgi:uncharacterized membrane protein|nr:DUF2069 domain-containing protein [Kangiellaceae bacterium]
MTLTKKLNFLHLLVQVSFFALFALLSSWSLYLFPPERFSATLLATIWLLPLVFPTWGVIKRKLYTYAWLQFITMIYFCHAIVYMMTSPAEFWIALAEFVLVMINFTAAILAIRINKQLNHFAR